ncbi:MAG: GGDEF domain-containing protein [Ectothiorhodospiraceae bacterium]|nr:GGDEF domain-containing protein [Ectothiorhodospiraceae bacterium]
MSIPRLPIVAPRRRLSACWLCLLLMLLASATSSAGERLDVAARDFPLVLGPHAEILEDPDGGLSINTVLAGLQAQDWQPSRQQTLNFSFSDSAYWLRFELGNESDRDVTRLMELAMPLHDYLDVYLVAGGEVLEALRSGNRLPFASRPINYRNVIVPITVPAGEQRQLYLRLATHDGLYDATPLYLWGQEAFFLRAQGELLWYGVYYGALLALLAYNLLLFISTRERQFIYYVAYLTAFFVWNFTFRGYAYQYWWPEWPTLNSQMVAVSSALIYVTLTLFSIDFLDLRQQAPRLRRILIGLTALIAATLPLALLGHYALTFRLLIPAGIAYLLFIYALAALLSWRGHAPARIYLLAWSVLVAGAVLYYLRVLNVLPSNFITENALQIGSGLEFVLLAFGLAYKLNRQKAERLDAEKAFSAIQTQLSQELEDKVRERTTDLEALNRRLQEMAATDVLTGLGNRRHFNALFNREFDRSRRQNKLFCFCIMDIDRFKEYNDSYGHQAGDEVLRRVAGLLSDHLRRAGDHAFRLGGEEFGIMLDVDSTEQAVDRIETVRRAIEQQRIEQESAPDGILTASFGLVCCTDYKVMSRTHDVYLAADNALYRAKAQGRNQLRIHGPGERQPEPPPPAPR